MSLREVLALTKIPIKPQMKFSAQLVKTLVSLVIQLTNVCQDHEIDIHRLVHCFDMKSNQWHIAVLQIYENMFEQEAQLRYERGQLRFDKEGNLANSKKKSSASLHEPQLTMSGALRPLLEMIDEYRKSSAAPETSVVLRKHAKYADLNYIQTRLKAVESEVHYRIFAANKKQNVMTDYLEGDSLTQQNKHLNINIDSGLVTREASRQTEEGSSAHFYLSNGEKRS